MDDGIPNLDNFTDALADVVKRTEVIEHALLKKIETLKGSENLTDRDKCIRWHETLRIFSSAMGSLEVSSARTFAVGTPYPGEVGCN